MSWKQRRVFHALFASTVTFTMKLLLQMQLIPYREQILSQLRRQVTENVMYIYTGLFEMIVCVLTTCHTQYTLDSSM